MRIACFKGGAGPGALHSFPTRRSSDLVRITPRTLPNCARQKAGSRGISWRFLFVQLFDQRFSLDRKSTRLNSSHRCISYAVFCLKKIRLSSLSLHTVAWYLSLSFVLCG